MDIRYLTRHATARPGLERACRAHRLGLPIPKGLRFTFQGGQCYYFQLRRRYHPARQFHALGARGRGRSLHERAMLSQGLYSAPARPAPCALCGQRNPKGLHASICSICLDYAIRYGQEMAERERDLADERLASVCECFRDALEHPACLLAGRCLRLAERRRRAPIARPLWFPGDPMHMLRCSRQRPHAILVAYPDLGKYAAWWHRPRTKFRYSRFRAGYLHKRRSLARQAQRRGYELIKAGLWYDRAADVVYCQSAVDLRPVEQVQLRRGA